ncbi:hypothetical protein J6590_010447 [Homalodisca vitripennis]|nr:hypothetical protein J6590_010447 [Homalodisca vitripennis]
MPMSCVAFGCFNKGKLEGITYHSFPKGAEQWQRWINAVRRKDWEPNRPSRLCSSYFREADIDRTSLCRVRIREGAVPANFPAFSEVKDRKPLKRKEEPEMCSTSSFVSPTKKFKIALEKCKSDVLTYKKKVKGLQQNRRQLKKRVANLESILESLKEKLN